MGIVAAPVLGFWRLTRNLELIFALEDEDGVKEVD